MTLRTIQRYKNYLGIGIAFLTGLILASQFTISPRYQEYSIIQAMREAELRDHIQVEKMDNEMFEKGHKVSFDDKHKHHDDDTVARELKEDVRIMCWVMTCEENHRKKADHVMATWGKRCNKILFVSDGHDDALPVVVFDDIGKGREHLTGKTMRALKYTYDHLLNEADWFLKADDDTYIIVENLRYFLSSENPEEPVYFGHHFKAIVKQGYFSGGGGYVISKEAIRKFGSRNTTLIKCRDDGGAEDAELGLCMQKLGVRTGDSRDALGRSRFHCFDPGTFISGGYPDWFLKTDKYGAKSGIDSISDYPISFHYIPANRMYHLEYFTYHLRPYGIQMEDQDLNGPPKQEEPKKLSNSSKT